MEKQTKTNTTVNEFFTWYAGSEWETSGQITNTMTIDGVHAQDSDWTGSEAKRFMIENRDQGIEIEETDSGDISFTVNGKLVSVQACDSFTNPEPR